MAVFCMIPREEHDLDAGASLQPHLEPHSPTRHKMFLDYVRSAWEYVRLKIKVAIYIWKHCKVLRKILEDVRNHAQIKWTAIYDRLQADREFDSDGSDIDTPLQPLIPISSETGTPLQPGVTISSQTEIGQTEESIQVPKQRAYIGSKLVISSSLANIPCCCLGVQGLLDLFNTTLETPYTLDNPSRSSALEDCIAKNYDFGTAYGRLRLAWYYCDIQMELSEREAEDIKQRENAIKGSRIVDTSINPRRVWDLYSNRVVPWWCCKVGFSALNPGKVAYPISHAWVDEVDRIDVWTPINGYQWPVPIPKSASLDLIRIEMLNLGVEYTWLDVICLRQRGGPREDLRVEEWKLDVPTIGAIYKYAKVVWYLSGLGLPLSLKEGDLESDRCWFRRAWTVQEVGQTRTIAGDTPDGPLHAEPIDQAGNYENEILTKFHKQLKSVTEWDIGPGSVYGVLSTMQDRTSTNPVDKVAGLVFSLWTAAIPSYYENQSLEGAWTAFMNEMIPLVRGVLFFTYPGPGTECKTWRPSWEQVMEKSLPKDVFHPVAFVWRDDDDWYEGPCIERGLVRGLAVEGKEGKDRHGELIVEDADGIAHSFNILTRHQYPIPEDTYTLLGTDPPYSSDLPRCWVVGRRLPNKMFEKVSVLALTGIDEIKRLEESGFSVKSISILA